MRFIKLVFVLLAAQLVAHSAPRKVARKAPVARLKAAPLSPEKLRGQATYIQGRDVWAIDPTTRQKHLLFKDLFYPAKASLENENFGGTLNFHSNDITWSPDCKLVVFTRRAPSHGGAELFLIRWDGTQKSQLTDTQYNLVSDEPHFSPDGKQLLYTQRTAYRMGGPGYTELRIHVLDLASKKDVAIGPPETSYAPNWSRDGKRILFSYFKGNIDYTSEGPPPIQQTMLPNGTDIQPYADDWQNYLGENQSRDGQSRAVRTPTGTSAVWEIYRFDTVASQGIVQQEDGGLQPSRFVWLDTQNPLIMQASLFSWLVGKDDIAHIQFENNIWSIDRSKNVLRLLIKDAQLIDWL